jgi:3'-phosphoadenosine 5'-phosphosulfate (PAPS) 3'-phosphatase
MFESQSALPPYTELLCVTKEACVVISTLVKSLYETIGKKDSKLAKQKPDMSTVTVADGLVQYLLSVHLFGGGKFEGIVGEEDGEINLDGSPFTVEGITVPEAFEAKITEMRSVLSTMAARVPADAFRDATIFIDPIDGTREFALNLGEQSTICVGFAVAGRPVAGIVYRPLTDTWAMGCGAEQFHQCELDLTAPNPKGFLCSNGRKSNFTQQLAEELGYELVPSGGVGNKMLMLLEGKASCYIQDRSVFRWDTCAAQAILESQGGALTKLHQLNTDDALESYCYCEGPINQDFLAGHCVANRYSLKDQSKLEDGVCFKIDELNDAKPYFNMFGLFALKGLGEMEVYKEALSRASAKFAPEY